MIKLMIANAVIAVATTANNQEKKEGTSYTVDQIARAWKKLAPKIPFQYFVNAEKARREKWKNGG